MNCLHPRKKKIVDAITGEVREITYPCGHCINCLHAEQDMWSIRLSESGKEYKQMVYDTLTIRPSSMRILIDFTKPTKEGTLYGSTLKYSTNKVNMIFRSWKNFHRYYPKYSYDTYQMLKKTKGKVYYFPKEEVQNWLKRGRERYKRDTGIRTDISYFICQEYGPQTSRPHYHILMFGINYLDYMKYFGHPWNKDFGYTKPTWKPYTPWNMDDYNKMTKYVSKYVTKGDYESPFVKDGFQEKPYRLVSKGIGKGYLDKDKFDIYKNKDWTSYKQYHMPSDNQLYFKVRTLREEGKESEAHKYLIEGLARQEETRSMIGPDLSSLSEQNIKDLQVYYDEAGYPHKLPRYYTQKLFGGTNNEKNIYQSEIQVVLQQSACLHTNQDIQRIALDLGIIIPDRYLTQPCEYWDLPESTLSLVLDKYDAVQRSQAQALAERRKIRLENFYNRSKQNTSAPALL